MHWRDYLRKLIAPAGEKEKLALTLNVNPTTIWRWVSINQTKPRDIYLQIIPRCFPEPHRSELRRLIAQERPDLFESFSQPRIEALAEVPLNFYERPLAALQEEDGIALWTVLFLCLRQLMTQFAAEGEVSIFVLQLSPSSQTLFLQQGVTYDEKDSKLSLPLFFVGQEEEVPVKAILTKEIICKNHSISLPFIRRGKVAGVLWIQMSHPSGFSQAKLELCKRYAHLIAVAFEDKDFWICDQICLKRVLPQSEQKKITQKYHWSIINTQKMRAIICEIEKQILLEQGADNDE